ncbi:malto-oligosyltrehalose trehalohydrolase [Herbaspirillum sp. RTI4]|uniref:malto-oligosyltrehalose trehalohydrolase n=1 Tax=Herbaspirillum sp. RTI4 TaxID=3048640 RepID=UPI002AB474E6|nr:malto-oligosyltrehalose trehalohydrolase [Herbaspirillum sp. RTI4]MDY7579063.1 malto-oligosyltrehalose trehalohydrolase [Herbaspirillum sp. RTI4]MEA9982353.1 malto-oligosyltrehalose trehalohydrolase [Herbaspirillum sp. RTI4]
MNQHFSYSLPFGAQLLSPDRTYFRLWAPLARAAWVDIEGGAHIAMPEDPDADGWFAVEAVCRAGTAYRYVLSLTDGTKVTVPDPASRAQRDDVHGPSVVVDDSAYVWQHPEWQGLPWHETVIYELHVGAMGGYDCVRQRLPELAALGITAVELMPVADFPGSRNWGYDGVLPFAPHASYGTPDELKALIDTAHGLGMMVFLDVVFNHFGPDGNYLSLYAKPFFSQEAPTEWGDTIDFSRPEVSNFFMQAALHWVHDYRFDGLRLDAAQAIREQDWLPRLSRRLHESVPASRHLHLVLEHEGNAAHLLDRSKLHETAFDAQWNDDGHHVLHVLLTGEQDGYYSDFAEDAAEKLARCLRDGFIYQGEPSAYRGGVARGEPSAQLPPTSFVLFLQNHDQIGNRPCGERLTTLAHPAALRAAQALLLLSPQIPLLFMGEEFGARQPFFYFTDHANEALAQAVREGRRREFSRFPHLAATAVNDRMPDVNNLASFVASIPHRTPSDASENALWHSWTQRLLEIRKARIVPHLVHAKSLSAKALAVAAVNARWRLGDGTVLNITLNLGAAAQPQVLDDLLGLRGAEILFDSGGTLDALAEGNLPAYSILVLLEAADAEGRRE